jgi:hypothetical protein
MPIRFRCAYCNQLLGIARRKAGTVIRCPTCSGQVVVPAAAAAVQEPSSVNGGQPVFERSDFDDLLKLPVPLEDASSPTAGEPPGAPAPPSLPPAGAWGTHAEPEFDVERLDPVPLSPGRAAGGLPAGLVLSPARTTVLAVAAVVALALSFGAGFLVGRLASGG